MQQVWEKDLPKITPEHVQRVRERDSGRWYAALPATISGHPRLGWNGLDERTRTISAIQRATDAPTVRRRNDLRCVSEEILERRWLRVNDHQVDPTTRLSDLLGFPVPVYRAPAELIGDNSSKKDVYSELWQRDVGDALPGLALAALLFPDLAEICRDRLKAIVMAALTFPTWGVSAPFTDMDLPVDHIARGIAIAYDWHRDLWTDKERDHIGSVLRQKLGTLMRGAYGDAFWAQSWTDNHCQNAFAALGICGTCFLGEIPEAEEWLGAAVAGFEIGMPLCNADGSSAEGVPYWSYGMSFLLQYIELTKSVTGADSLYETSYLRHSANYRLHCSLPDLSGAVTFGDANLQDYYGPAHLLYALARHYRDGAAQWFGDTIPFPNRSGADIEAWSLLWRDATLPPAPPATIPVDCHLSAWDVAVTRSGWGPNDYALAVKSGFTNRSHSHLDAGTLLFGWGGEWLIDAPGYGQAGPGFWDTHGPRWEYYSNSTESHTTLLINGKNQRFAADARGTIVAFESTSDQCHIDIDLTEVYEDTLRVRRQFFHRRGQYILVLDEIDFVKEIDTVNRIEWLLQPGKTVSITKSGTPDDSTVVLQGKTGSMQVQVLTPPNEATPTFAPRAHTAQHLDIPQDAVRTLALTEQGNTPSMAFAVLIVPNGVTDITAYIETWMPGQRSVGVHGPGFQDKLTAD